MSKEYRNMRIGRRYDTLVAPGRPAGETGSCWKVLAPNGRSFLHYAATLRDVLRTFPGSVVKLAGGGI